ncbi:MAG: DUF4178 domain-containing protein [Candidatus Binatia bacterium]
MSTVQASCPGCGAPVIFKISVSLVVVCEFCRSVVARGDRDPEDLGKIAYLVETDSPLTIGLHGSYQGEAFELTGRAQFAHEAGGIWNEWYAAFPNDKWGWLAEAQGRFYLTFEQRLATQQQIRPFEELVLGEKSGENLPLRSLVVVEKGVARAVSAEGEIPYRLIPDAEHTYADLSGPRGEFATIDYGEDPPQVFIGREVELAELGFSSATVRKADRRIAAQHLSCPQCAGALTLQAPDKTERVTCPSCGSLLDVNQGTLTYLRTLEYKVTPIIPIGTTGTLDGVPLMVIGFLQRRVSDTRYSWEEYLLYNPTAGFRWLVRSDNHWNFVTPLPPGKVVVSGFSATYQQKKFRRFQEAAARVEYVLGEFYWKVAVGETVTTADYVAPPLMLSREGTTGSAKRSRRQKNKSETDTVQTGEINWSLGTYLPRERVEQAFNVKALPQPTTIAPNQPYPHQGIFRAWGYLLLAAVAIALILNLTTWRKTVFQQSYQNTSPSVAASASDAMWQVENPNIYFSDPFTLRARRNIKITGATKDSTLRVEIVGDLVDHQTNKIREFSLSLGASRIKNDTSSQGNEQWVAERNVASVLLSAVPAGTYSVRLNTRWVHSGSPSDVFTITVEQGVPNSGHFWWTLVALSVFPIYMGFKRMGFELQRWGESDFLTIS